MAAARSCAALSCPAVPAAAAAARGTTAAIVGRVSDATGAARPGATIAIENVATHDVRAAPANGKYRVNLAPIAAYTARGSGRASRRKRRACRCRPAIARGSTHDRRLGRSRRT